MSENESIGQEAPTPPPDADPFPTLKVAAFGFVSLVVFGASVVVMFLFMEHWRTGPSPRHAPLPPQVGQSTINLVDQKDYSLVSAARREAPLRERLRSYGWADRQRGLIHVPVERAMDALVSQGGQGGGR